MNLRLQLPLPGLPHRASFALDGAWSGLAASAARQESAPWNAAACELLEPECRWYHASRLRASPLPAGPQCRRSKAKKAGSPLPHAALPSHQHGVQALEQEFPSLLAQGDLAQRALTAHSNEPAHPACDAALHATLRLEQELRKSPPKDPGNPLHPSGSKALHRRPPTVPLRHSFPFRPHWTSAITIDSVTCAECDSRNRRSASASSSLKSAAQPSSTKARARAVNSLGSSAWMVVVGMEVDRITIGAKRNNLSPSFRIPLQDRRPLLAATARRLQIGRAARNAFFPQVTIGMLSVGRWTFCIGRLACPTPPVPPIFRPLFQIL